MSPSVTLRSRELPSIFIFSLFFSPSPFCRYSSPSSRTRSVVLESIDFPRVPKRPISLSRVSPSYIHRPRGKGIRAAQTCAVRHPILLPSACCTESTNPTIDFQPSTSNRLSLSLSLLHQGLSFVTRNSSRKICKHSPRIGRGARIEEERDEATNNVELTLAGDSNFNGWKANMAV